MADILERLRDKDAMVARGLFHAVPTMSAAALEIERLRAVERAARRLIKEGLRGTWDSNGNPIQAVVEKADSTDAHYELCTALEVISPLNR